MATATVAPGVGEKADPIVRAWQVARGVVLGLYVVTLVLVALTGFRIESYGELRSGLERGDVTQVRAEGVLGAPEAYPDGVQGVTTVRLEWQDGWHRSVTEITQASSVEELRSQGFDTPAGDYIIGDVGPALRQFSPDVEIIRAEPSNGIFAEAAGWEVRGMPAYLVGLLLVSFLVLVLSGPEPRLATRWAWVWLALSPALIVTVPIFLLLGARGQIPGRRRLNGVVAFLLCVLVLGGLA